MIHICYTIRDVNGKYSKFIGTSMLSMFENTTEQITIHLIHDSTLTNDNRKKFIDIVSRYAQQIRFYNVDELVSNEIQLIKNKISEEKFSRWSIAMFYRFFIPNFIHESKIIYLDADIIVNLDINELWTIDLKNYPLAAIPEYLSLPYEDVKKATIPLCRENIIDWQNYFNSGVIVMNLNSIGTDLFKLSMEILQMYNHICKMLDQDALNIIFDKNYLKLPMKFNAFVRDLRLTNQPQIITKSIYHYTDWSLNLEMSDCFNRLWFLYFILTPFCNGYTFENFLQATEKKCITENFLWHKLLLATATKSRIFINYSKDTKNLSEYFGINDRDQILEITGNNFETDIISIVKNSTDDQFFIICVEDHIYNRIRDQLTEFKEFDKFMNTNFCFNNPILDSAELIQKI